MLGDTFPSFSVFSEQMLGKENSGGEKSPAPSAIWERNAINLVVDALSIIKEAP